jgi:hypothetical protein
VEGSCEYGDEPAGSGATKLVGWLVRQNSSAISRQVFPTSLLDVSPDNYQRILAANHELLEIG